MSRGNTWLLHQACPRRDPVAARYCSCWCNLPFPQDIFFPPSYHQISHHRQILSFWTKQNIFTWGRYRLPEWVTSFSFEWFLALLGSRWLLLSIIRFCAVWAETCPLRFLWQALQGVGVVLQGQLGQQCSLLWQAVSGMPGGINAVVKHGFCQPKRNNSARLHIV